jgi:hypothetical protein
LQDSTYDVCYATGAISHQVNLKLTECEPGQTVEVPINSVDAQKANVFDREAPHAELYMNVTFTLREVNDCADACHTVATAQFRLRGLVPVLFAQPTAVAPRVEKMSPSNVEIYRRTSPWTMDLVTGQLLSWTKAGQKVLAAPPTLGFYRPQTDHDEAGAGKAWTAKMP